MPPNSHAFSTCRLSPSCPAYRLVGGVVLPPNPMPSSRLINACAWQRPSPLRFLPSGVHESRWSSEAALLTPRAILLALLENLIRSQQDGGIVSPSASAVLRLTTN